MALSLTGLDIAFPTAEEIIASIQARIQAVDSLLTNLNAGGLSETMFEAVAIALGSDASTLPNVTQEGAYELLQNALAQAFISTASGYGLDLKAADVGVTRKQASYAGTVTGRLTLSAALSTDTTFPAGAVVSAEQSDPTQPPVPFALVANVTVPAGQLTVSGIALVCLQSGSVGNQPANSITNIVQGLPGVASFTNDAATSGGADTEQDDSPNGGLRARALAAIPNASQCTIAAIKEYALSFAGVTSAYVLDRTADDLVTFQRGQSQLFLDDGSGDLASNAPLIAAIQLAFNTGLGRAAGDGVTVHGSTTTAVTVYIPFDASNDYVTNVASEASIEAAMQLAVYTYVNALPIGAPLVLSVVIATAQGVAGVSNVRSGQVTINGTNADFLPSLPYETLRCAALASVTASCVGVTTYEQ